MDLHDYERAKFALADLLRAAAPAGIHQDTRGAAARRDLFERLAADRFNLAVIGRFNRGKTSLMNAMLGMDRLPTGVVPLTSVITAVSYGTQPKATLHYHNTSLFMDVPLDELPRHITERGNPGNREGVSMAEVHLPADLLRLGFHFIDTPGLGSSVLENTRTTEQFLPEIDALVLVTSYDSALTEEECRILDGARDSGCPVFVILNKQDAVSRAARAEVLAHVRDRLGRGAEAAPPVFSLSATEALAARLAGNAAALAESGLPAFEAALTTFLVEERRGAFLAGLCGRIENLLGQAGDIARLDELAALRARLIQGGARPAAAASLPAREAPLAGCDVCGALAEAAAQFLSRYQLALYGDAAAQGQLAARGGLCDAHLPQLESLAAPREIATGFAPVMAAQAARLRAVASRRPTGQLACDAVTAIQAVAAVCPACEAVAPAGMTVLHRLAASVRQSGAAALYRRSAPCLRHLAELARLLEDAGLVGDLLDLQAALMERLEEDLRRLSLKQDAAHRHAISAEERSAPQRALHLLASLPAARLAAATLRPAQPPPPP